MKPSDSLFSEHINELKTRYMFSKNVVEVIIFMVFIYNQLHSARLAV